MLDLAVIPQAVIWSILGSVSGWLVLWLTTRRRPKRLPIIGIVFIAIAASTARQHPNWPDSQAASPLMVALAAGLVVAITAYWFRIRSPEA